MLFLKRFTQSVLRLTGIEAFSNGVFAIIVTLPVLEPSARAGGGKIACETS